MFKVIIYWDAGTVHEICGESKPELYKKLDSLNINPEEAIWEFKWEPTPNGVKQETLDNIMGKIGKVE